MLEVSEALSFVWCVSRVLLTLAPIIGLKERRATRRHFTYLARSRRYTAWA